MQICTSHTRISLVGLLEWLSTSDMCFARDYLDLLCKWMHLSGVGQYKIVGLYGDLSGARVNVLYMVNWCGRGYLRLYANLAHARVFTVL